MNKNKSTMPLQLTLNLKAIEPESILTERKKSRAQRGDGVSPIKNYAFSPEQLFSNKKKKKGLFEPQQKRKARGSNMNKKGISYQRVKNEKGKNCSTKNNKKKKKSVEKFKNMFNEYNNKNDSKKLTTSPNLINEFHSISRSASVSCDKSRSRSHQKYRKSKEKYDSKYSKSLKLGIETQRSELATARDRKSKKSTEKNVNIKRFSTEKIKPDYHSSRSRQRMVTQRSNTYAQEVSPLKQKTVNNTNKKSQSHLKSKSKEKKVSESHYRSSLTAKSATNKNKTKTKGNNAKVKRLNKDTIGISSKIKIDNFFYFRNENPDEKSRDSNQLSYRNQEISVLEAASRDLNFEGDIKKTKRRKVIPQIKTEVSEHKEEFFDEILLKKLQNQQDAQIEDSSSLRTDLMENQNFKDQNIISLSQNLPKNNQNLMKSQQRNFCIEKDHSEMFNRNGFKQRIDKEKYIINIEDEISNNSMGQVDEEQYKRESLGSEIIEQENRQKQGQGQKRILKLKIQSQTQNILEELSDANKKLDQLFKKSSFDEEDKEISHNVEKQSDLSMSVKINTKELTASKNQPYKNKHQQFPKNTTEIVMNSGQETIENLRHEQQRKWKVILEQLNILKTSGDSSKQKIEEIIRLSEENYFELQKTKKYEMGNKFQEGSLSSSTSSINKTSSQVSKSKVSYERQNPKAISEMMRKKRKSIEEQKSIVKNLSDKKLLEQLEFLGSFGSCRDQHQSTPLKVGLLQQEGEYQSLKYPSQSQSRKQTPKQNISIHNDFMVEDSQTQQQQTVKPRRQNSLSLEFQNEMQDYLSESSNHLKARLGEQIQGSMSLLSAMKQKSYEGKDFMGSMAAGDEQKHAYADMDLINASPLMSDDKRQQPHQRSPEQQKVREQIVSRIVDRLLREFCHQLDFNKTMLHTFLFYVSSANDVLGLGLGGIDHSQQRQVNPLKFQEYLERRVQNSNSYVMGLAKDLFAFIRDRSAHDHAEKFLCNINKSFGLKPIKTLRWMRKAYQQVDPTEEYLEESSSNEQQSSQSEAIEAVLYPILLADFDAYKNEQVFEQINQQQYYLNHSVYACLNEILDSFRPYGQIGPSVIPSYQPTEIISISSIENKTLKKLSKLISIRMGRDSFYPEEQPEKIVSRSYKMMDKVCVEEEQEKWNPRNMEDMVFESEYYMSQQIIDFIFNEEVLVIFKTINCYSG